VRRQKLILSELTREKRKTHSWILLLLLWQPGELAVNFRLTRARAAAEKKSQMAAENTLTLETGSQCVVEGFKGGKKVPIVLREAHDQEEAPNRKQSAGILWMIEI
jgi:hypothetical protein